MVLVNTLTVEAINTALIALQRGQSIVVGGEKPGTTVNNITISNGGGGSGGSGLDFTPQITALDKRVGLLEKAEELLRQENERQNERLEALEGLGITDFYFDDTSRELTIELANGEVFDTEVTSESFSMEVVNGELIIRIGEQVHTVNLPMGSQADWTQTDSDDPSFIKHKIPIWITQGSADDNMSPIDSVTDGSMRPVTSNAVFDKHYLTSADITNQVTVDNMQSVSSNAVAQEVNTINGVLNSIGSIVNGTMTTGTYTGSGSFKADEVGYINLTKGTWVVLAQIEYGGRDTSNSSVVGLAIADQWRIRVPNLNSANDLDLQCVGIVGVGSNSYRCSITLFHHQTVIVTGATYCRAVKIK